MNPQLDERMSQMIDQVLKEVHTYDAAAQVFTERAWPTTPGQLRLIHERCSGLPTTGPMIDYLIASIASSGLPFTLAQQSTEGVFFWGPQGSQLIFEYRNADNLIGTFDAWCCEFINQFPVHEEVSVQLHWWNSHHFLDEEEKYKKAVDDMIRVLRSAFCERLNCIKPESVPAYTEINHTKIHAE